MATVFPSGTKTFFLNSTATTGWTKDTTYNDATLRIVSGSASSGGVENFTAIYANPTGRPYLADASYSPQSAGGTTLSGTTLPAHQHSYAGVSFPTSPTTWAQPTASPASTGGPAISLQVTGSGRGPGQVAIPASTSSHTHTFNTVAARVSGDIFVNVSYVDLILVTKD
jgi:hypothetical protein